MKLMDWWRSMCKPADRRLTEKCFAQAAELAILRTRVKELSKTIEDMSKSTISPLEMRRTVKDYQATIRLLEERLALAEHFKETVSKRLQAIGDKLDHYLKREEVLQKKMADAAWPAPVGERPRQHNQD